MSSPPTPPPPPSAPLGTYAKALSADEVYGKAAKAALDDKAHFEIPEIRQQLALKPRYSSVVTFYSDDPNQSSPEILSLVTLQWPVGEGIIVVEDLDTDHMIGIGHHYNVDVMFFQRHALHAVNRHRGEMHLDLEFRSYAARDSSLVPMQKLRISCCKLKDGLYLMLMTRCHQGNLLKSRTFEVTLKPADNDPPGKMILRVRSRSMDFRSEKYLRAALDISPTPDPPGILGQLLLDLQGSGFLSLLNWTPPAFSSTTHKWRDSSGADMALCWLLAIRIWRTNFDLVDEGIEQQSYTAISAPNRDVLNNLAKLRGAIADARRAIASIRADVRVNSLNYYDDQAEKAAKNGNSRVKTSTYFFELLDRRTAELKEAVNDSTQFLIGAITVQDAQRSLEQASKANIMARRATALTVLAAIYLPLSLVTSIFGMNIAQLDPGPQWWTVLIPLAIILLPTVAIVAFVLRSQEVVDPAQKSPSAKGISADVNEKPRMAFSPLRWRGRKNVAAAGVSSSLPP